MKWIILLFICSCYGIFNIDLPPLIDDKCSFTRNDVYTCLKTYVDIDKSNSITKKELDTALKKNIPGKAIAWTLSFGINKVFEYCDYNKDGILSPRDFKLSKKTCLIKQTHLCTLKWFCDKAAKQ